mmetsp:Transcript_53112/g.99518  ORF Transcript_53112/g.99518 Transcript_53112/m.99518 type:complete len:353 (-) Transcript_53112:48-1106(-)
MRRFAQILSVLSILGVQSLDQNAVRLKYEAQQAQVMLRSRLQGLSPEQQEDLAMVVPYLKKGDKAAFKEGLSTMVQHGGNDRIKRCLQGLSAIGFDALEIQNWMTHDGAPTPQSKMVPKPSQQTPPASLPSEHSALRSAPKDVKPLQPAVAPPVATVGAMAGLAAEQQLAGGQQKQRKGEEEQGQVTVQQHLETMTKAQEKVALRKELARRLSKGVQAFKRVETMEKTEANMAQQLAADSQRLGKLEQALQQEEQQEAKVEKENSELKHKLEEQAAVNTKTLARLDALEARGAGGASDSRVAALEEQNSKFRAALAGAARRLINLEADVTSQKQAPSQQGPKVVRHEKKPGA